MKCYCFLLLPIAVAFFCKRSFSGRKTNLPVSSTSVVRIFNRTLSAVSTILLFKETIKRLLLAADGEKQIEELVDLLVSVVNAEKDAAMAKAEKDAAMEEKDAAVAKAEKDAAVAKAEKDAAVAKSEMEQALAQKELEIVRTTAALQDALKNNALLTPRGVIGI
jgi:spore cortex formation protein SpoVR/YcgB (stage V sporulation)